jgi:C4-dicarboxylate-specific signal transduction histidine kinase
MEDMLLWSKHQMTQFKPQVKAVPVTTLFEYIKIFFSSTQNIQFVFEQQTDLKVYSDENYLKAIMQNLTANAVKALSKTTNPCIVWKAWKQDDKIMLSITDNGSGMSDTVAKTLFTDDALPNATTGFGMQIVKDLARAVECNISLKQNSLSGVTFELATAIAFPPYQTKRI